MVEDLSDSALINTLQIFSEDKFNTPFKDLQGGNENFLSSLDENIDHGNRFNRLSD
jgi:hypothetical protein